MTGNSKIVASNNIINRNNQYGVNSGNSANNANNRATNQSVKLPKVQTPNSSNQIQANQLPDISVKRSMEGTNGVVTNGVAVRVPTSKDSRRRIV